MTCADLPSPLSGCPVAAILAPPSHFPLQPLPRSLRMGVGSGVVLLSCPSAQAPPSNEPWGKGPADADADCLRCPTEPASKEPADPAPCGCQLCSALASAVVNIPYAPRGPSGAKRLLEPEVRGAGESSRGLPSARGALSESRALSMSRVRCCVTSMRRVRACLASAEEVAWRPLGVSARAPETE